MRSNPTIERDTSQAAIRALARAPHCERCRDTHGGARKSAARTRPKTDIVALARFLTAGIQGLCLLGKVNPDRAALDDIASVMLRCLR